MHRNLSQNRHPVPSGTSRHVRFTDVPDVPGARMAYLDEGEGRPVIFLHGNPTSSYLWRDVIPHVAGSARTIALDLVGMGDSAKPDIRYTLDEHCACVEAFVDSLALGRPAVFVGHDWGGVIAVRHARRHPGEVAGLVLMETHLPPRMPAADYAAMGDGAEFFRRLREPGTGERMVLDENVFIETVLPGPGVLRELEEAEMAAYRAPYPTPASRQPMLRWAREIPIDGTPARSVEILGRNNDWLHASALPKLLLHARPGALVQGDTVDYLRDHLSNLEIIDVGEGTHFIQEDAPAPIGRAIAAWLAGVPEVPAP